jgi:3-hydroxybutyryl-CoA dehydrogenase
MLREKGTETLEIKNILIYGSGMMGKNIAFVFSSNPAWNIVICGRRDVDISGGIRASCAPLINKGIICAEEIERRLSRVKFTKDIEDEGVRNADLIIEAVSEDMGLKQETFEKLEKHCRSDAIFCTNSSVMSPSEISSKLKYRSRFAGTHFWNPAHLIPLVEVVKSDATSDETANTIMDVLAAAGKKPLLCKKDAPGFIANRMQHALWREAIYIVEQGIADAKTVDDAVRYSFGLRLPQLGPLENADMVGLDLTYNIHSYILKHLCSSAEPSPLLKRLYEEGKNGFKTGEGFQKWTDEGQRQSLAALNEYLVTMLAGK